MFGSHSRYSLLRAFFKTLVALSVGWAGHVAIAADTSKRKGKVPSYLSVEAQASLARISADAQPEDYPALRDRAGWRKHIADHNEKIIRTFSFADQSGKVSSSEFLIDGVRAVMSRPKMASFPEDRVVLDIHGGAFIYLGGIAVKPMSQLVALRFAATVVSVDYRMPPDYPFPAGLDDCLTVYRALLAKYGSKNIIVSGSSAGGNLAAAVVLKARDQGLVLPTAVILQSPEADLTESGDTFYTLDGLDRLKSLRTVNALYAGAAALTDPFVSPLFGDFKKGFPPTLLQSGTRDLFLSNTVRLHRKLRDADVAAELHIWDAMPHGRFGNAPEDLEVDAEIRRFLRAVWG